MEVSNHGHDLGIKMIDRDHREISELLLEINFNATRDENADRKIRRLRILSRVTRSHFLLEEAMMAAAKYPGLAVHRTRHAWMLEEIRRLAEYWDKKKGALTREPMGLLWESHIEHVECEDRAYGLWLGDTGGESERNRSFFLMNP
jgi:hemerythrin-like metal-binding protein